jgi:putative ABC transport system ATP-binding protein
VSAAGAPLVRVVDLRKSYVLGDVTVHALRGVSLEIEKGSFNAVVGASGSGKSTFMNILGLLDRPSAGTTTSRARTSRASTATAARVLRNRKIGFVFQTSTCCRAPRRSRTSSCR